MEKEDTMRTEQWPIVIDGVRYLVDRTKDGRPAIFRIFRSLKALRHYDAEFKSPKDDTHDISIERLIIEHGEVDGGVLIVVDYIDTAHDQKTLDIDGKSCAVATLVSGPPMVYDIVQGPGLRLRTIDKLKYPMWPGSTASIEVPADALQMWRDWYHHYCVLARVA